MQQRPATPALTPARRRSLAEDVAEQVRLAILHGQLGPGQHLREEELAGRLQVSRGPIREALALLEREGLVRVARHRGASVVELTHDDLEELYSLRTGLEVVATQLAARRAEPADLAKAEAVLGRLGDALGGPITEQDAARMNIEFHDVVYRAARNSRLHASWMNIRSQVHLFLVSPGSAGPGWREAVVAGRAGHARILEAMRSGDEAAAARAASDHLVAAYARVLPGLATGAAPPLRLIPVLPPADAPE